MRQTEDLGPQNRHGISSLETFQYETLIFNHRNSRASLKTSGEEIMRNVRVAGQTRRKQYYMELHEVR